MSRVKLYLLILISVAVSSCMNGDGGELVGVQGRRPWFHPQPFGTVYVPTGTFHVGQADVDVFTTYTSPNKQITVTAFYMDDTEITNNEYRQFVHWVRDSIAAYTIGDEPYIEEDDDGFTHINWEAVNDELDYSDPEVMENLEDMIVPESERYYNQKGFDSRKFYYEWVWYDLKAAAMATKDANRQQFLRKERHRIYPDTLTFVRDYTYSFNEPMTQMYFWHPKYDNYPLVGVNWDQARAFCNWRTGYLNEFYLLNDEPIVNPFRLPTEYEWEYAARGGRDGSMYPWGGPYTRNSKGCFLANFKPGRGDYQIDGGVYPVRAYSYFPNDYGLFNMAGNVAEWTSTAWADESHVFTHDLNSEYYYDADLLNDQNPTMRRKVIRGGSWKDVAFFIANGTRTFEYQDTSKSYVGFRCVMSYMGRSNKDREP